MRKTKLSKVLGKLHTNLKTSADKQYDIAIVAYEGETEVEDFYDYASENVTVQEALDEYAEDHTGSILEFYNANPRGDLVILDVQGEGVQKATLEQFDEIMEDLKAQAEDMDDEDFTNMYLEVVNLYEANKDNLAGIVDELNETALAQEGDFYIHGIYDSNTGYSMIIPEE